MLATAIIGLIAVGFALWATGVPRDHAAPRLESRQIDLGSQYVGDRSCRECHPGEYAHQTRSGHAHTLEPTESTAFASWLEQKTWGDAEFQNSTWTYRREGGKIFANRAEGSTHEQYLLDYVLGSGKHARTYLTLNGREADGRPVAIEHRLTYFAHTDGLDITPGQRREGGNSGRGVEGRSLTAEETMLCLSCHATRLSFTNERVADPATLIRNVSCERCHGPARSHVESARAGRAADRLAFGSVEASSSLIQIQLCGQCHRMPEFVPKEQIRPDNALLARFQPVGLMQSRCYTQSQGTLSCSTCHDPHARTSTDSATYNKTCLDCHAKTAVAPCRKSPEGNCVACHMPKRDAGQGLLFVDHWIRLEAKK